MAIVMVATVVGVTLWLTDLSWMAQSGLIGLAAIGITVILRLKTIAEDALEE